MEARFEVKQDPETGRWHVVYIEDDFIAYGRYLENEEHAREVVAKMNEVIDVSRFSVNSVHGVC